MIATVQPPPLAKQTIRRGSRPFDGIPGEDVHDHMDLLDFPLTTWIASFVFSGLAFLAQEVVDVGLWRRRVSVRRRSHGCQLRIHLVVGVGVERTNTPRWYAISVAITLTRLDGAYWFTRRQVAMFEAVAARGGLRGLAWDPRATSELSRPTPFCSACVIIKSPFHVTTNQNILELRQNSYLKWS